ncbi:MAG: topoisomerase DNA-binding C4 zinc finger domain-containing protein, partial [Victivallales bacterium]|nr:topoisomerase DNA-binding C4 zinc finger domain-containing protein [Victivallales bacterium]
RSRQTAQEAHEAIRPTDVTRTPDSLVQYLEPQQLKLYRLIWNRFVASQMASSQQVDHAIEIESNGPALDTLPWQQAVDKATAEPTDAPQSAAVTCIFRTAARETKFPGYLIVYSARDLGEEDEMDEKKGILPTLPTGMPCNLAELDKEQGFTTPPNRFTEASLVKALEQNGVGRPSTFASTVSTIISRKYVGHQKGSLVPTELGYGVNDFLVQRMPELFNVGFTAKMESELDEIEEGKLNWTEMLRDFYDKFQRWLGTPVMVISKSDEQDVDNRLEQLFPEGFAFDTPVKGAQGKTYDDKKFITSLRKQVQDKKKDLTERQWSALFTTIAKYYYRDPEFKAKVDKLGWGENIRCLAEQKAQEQPHHAETEALSPAVLAMFEAMRKIEWQEPVKRGKRIYDDGRFFRSLYKAATGDKALTAAQLEAFQKLAEKYAAKIPDYAKLAADLNWIQEEQKAEERPALTDKQQQHLQALIAMVSKITKWNPPSSKGKRSFNDKEFANSLVQQFNLKGELSPKQIAALEKMLGKYSAQFSPEDKQILNERQVPKPELLEERCPKCNAPLIKRMGPRGPFIGCSAFPKCNYIAQKKQ